MKIREVNTSDGTAGVRLDLSYAIRDAPLKADAITKIDKSRVSLAAKSHGVLLKTFLPNDYPNSVRAEYLSYQIYDSIQGVCSSLRGSLTASSILQGVGVGSADVSVYSAAFSWMLRDGAGMIGGLLVAYKFSRSFEINCKEWRYFADILNNVSLLTDMLLYIYPPYFLAMSCFSTICKSCCGLIAGATKSRISSHFALHGHLADVTAKESTQETAVTLIGMILGIFVSKFVVGEDKKNSWIIFIALSLVHLWSNYCLIKVLILDTLNPQRCYLIVKYIIENSDNIGKSNICDNDIKGSYESQGFINFPNPILIRPLERLSNAIFLQWKGPRFGVSIDEIISSYEFDYIKNFPFSNHVSIKNFFLFWQKLECDFVIGFDSSYCVCVCLKANASEESMRKAAFIAYYIYIESQKAILNLRSSGNTRVSIAHYYDWLLNIRYNRCTEIKDWLSKISLETSLSSQQWDIGEGKTSLGYGSWRMTDIDMSDAVFQDNDDMKSR